MQEDNIEGLRGGPQLQEVLRQVEAIMISGLRHGHFRCTIISEVGKNKRRDLIIEAGMSHKFTIPLEELPG